MTARIRCCVPFCRRTFKADGATEVICGKHWRAVPAEVRQAKYYAYRSYKRRFGDNGWWIYPPASQERIECSAAHRRCHDAWERCKRAAIEAASGIG